MTADNFPTIRFTLATRAAAMSGYIPVISSEGVLNELPLHDIGPLISGFLAPFCFGSAVVMSHNHKNGSSNSVGERPVTLRIGTPSFIERLAAGIRKTFSMAS